MSQDSHTQSPVSQIGDMLDDGLILTNLDGVVLSANPAAVAMPFNLDDWKCGVIAKPR